MEVQAHTDQRSEAAERRAPVRMLKCEVFVVALRNFFVSVLIAGSLPAINHMNL